ncbi:hypothetical protein [Streptomyces sp. NPDC002889]|uniref:hypothetical protein n=1 Tax=Streptomyces sp. NPDC002889 TaxID=3364669 RepID=UPI0036C443E3
MGVGLERLHHDLLALDAEYRVESFAVKFGGLRITVCDRFVVGEFDGEFADRATALTDRPGRPGRPGPRTRKGRRPV